MLVVPKAVNGSKPFNLSAPLSHPICMCEQDEQLSPRPPSAAMSFDIRGNFLLRSRSAGGIGRTRVILMVGESVQVNTTLLMPVTLSGLAQRTCYNVVMHPTL